jgi:hypothetical protein
MRLPLVGWRRRILAILAAMLVGHGIASADPLTFYNVTNGRVDLFSNPGVVLPGEVVFVDGRDLSLVGFVVEVTGDLPNTTSDILRLTFHVPDVAGTCCRPVQEGFIPAGFLQPGNTYGYVFGLAFPLLYHPVPMGVTVDLLDSAPDFIIPSGPRAGEAVDSYTYTFSVVAPAPEPATMLLLLSGLGAAALDRRRRLNR